jgi:anti-sigma regulatory factor (Ser/Thr protein kinase)
MIPSYVWSPAGSGRQVQNSRPTEPHRDRGLAVGTSPVGTRARRLVETRRFSRDATAPARVRRLVSRHVGSGEAAGAAVLAASELATNAVRHGERAIPDTLRASVFREASVVTVEVVGKGTFKPAHMDGVGGFGLDVVDQLSTAWGIEQLDRCLKVWFSLEDVEMPTRRSRG